MGHHGVRLKGFMGKRKNIGLMCDIGPLNPKPVLGFKLPGTAETVLGIECSTMGAYIMYPNVPRPHEFIKKS